MYELRCLGEASLRGPAGQLIHFRSRKHFALLAYLALNSDRAHRRERLAGLLWSDSDDSRARHSLSQALYAVRRLLAGAVRIEGEDLELHPQNLRVDAVQLQRLLESGKAAAAADLYRGDFLEGFWVRGAQGFEEWAGRERARVAGLARDALRRAIKAARDRCEWSEVRRRAERLVQLEPFDEAAQAELMRAFWMLGDRTAALERYEELSRVLASELGTSPSRETEELANRIRERSVRGGWSRRILRESERRRFDDPPFIGRKRELAALAREWDHAAAGETRHVSLSGAAGIGKTRLAEEFFKSLALSDVTLLRGACYEAESSLPYGPVAEALRRGLDGLELADTAPLWLAELARIVPEVTERFPDLPMPSELDAEGGRRRLYEGIAQVLRTACESRPQLLFVDDLHWADDSSLSLLHYVRRRVSNGFYLLTAHRPEELAARGSTSLERLLSDRGIEVRGIELRGLDEEESSHLLEALLGERSDSSTLGSLREMSGGNPFFAIELAHNVAEAPGQIPPKPQVPGSIKSLLDRRFAGLHERSWVVLRQAAVLGSRSSYATLAVAAGLSPLELDGVVRELEEARILFESEGLLCFRHSLIRELIIESVPAALTGPLHRRAARALIRADGAPDEIARHLAAAGDERRAYAYALRGAREAERIFALQEAADLLHLAIQRAPTASTRSQLVGRLGKLYLHMREYSLARPLLEERLRYLEADCTSQLALMEARRDLLLVDTYSSRLTVQESAAEMKRLYERLEMSAANAHVLKAEILHSLLWAAARSFDTDLVEETIQRVRVLHNCQQRPAVRCRTSLSLGIYECYRGHLSSAEKLLISAEASAKQANNDSVLLDVYVGFTLLLHRTLNLNIAEYVLSTGVPLASEQANSLKARVMLSNCAVSYVHMHDIEQAEHLLHRATKQSSGSIPEMAPSINYTLGFIAHLKGDYQSAADYWTQALTISQQHGVLTVSVESLSALGSLALQEGHVTEARILAARALRLARHAGFLLDQRFGLEDLRIRLLYEKGQKDQAMGRLSELLPRVFGKDMPFYLTLQRTRIEFLKRGGQVAEAEAVARELSQLTHIMRNTKWIKESFCKHGISTN